MNRDEHLAAAELYVARAEATLHTITPERAVAEAAIAAAHAAIADAMPVEIDVYYAEDEEPAERPVAPSVGPELLT